MKSLLSIAILFSMSLAFADDKIQSLSQDYSFNCNGPKVVCYCPTRANFRKAVREQKVCGEGKKIVFTGTGIQKSFSDGGDQMNCAYTVNYICE
jgi:hypothetical protein